MRITSWVFALVVLVRSGNASWKSCRYPPEDAEVGPSWLGWTAAEWVEYRGAWYEQMQCLLGAEEYLQRVFQADARVRDAERELEHVQAGEEAGRVEESEVRLAARWLDRVMTWRENLRRALRSECLVVPGESARRWLLQLPPGRDLP